MIAAPGIIAGNEMQGNVLHVSPDGLEFFLDMLQHRVVVDIDMHHLALRQCLDKEMIGRIDSFYLSGPRVGVLGISEPCGLVLCPFGGHEISEFFWSHSSIYLLVMSE